MTAPLSIQIIVTLSLALYISRKGACRLLLLLGCVCLTTFCTVREPPKTRTPPVDMYDLMIDVSVFAQAWQLWHGPEPIPEQERREMESLYVVFRYEGLEPGIVGARHAVFRYRNEVDAATNFSRHGFLNRHVITPWAAPEGWSYESPVADRFRFACAEINILGVPRQFGNSVVIKDGLVQHMTIWLDVEVTLQGLLERYGPPESFTAWWEGVEVSYVKVTLYYPRHGFTTTLTISPDDVQLTPESKVERVWYFRAAALEEFLALSRDIGYPTVSDDVLQDWQGYGPMELIP